MNFQYQHIMQSDLQLNRKRLPSLASKQLPATSILEIIKQKKVQLTKQLEELDADEICLPIIPHQNPNEKKNSQSSQRGYQKIELSPESTTKEEVSELNISPKNKFKSILGQMETFQKSRIISKGQPIQQKQINTKMQNKNDKQSMKVFTIKSYNRTKTQAKGKEHKKSYSRNTKGNISVHKEHASQSTYIEEESEPIQKFITEIEYIPKNMKERNQENLSKTITQLQKFNPFFNRNTRIINVCLLKMGRIIFKMAPLELYKCGDELDYFYIVLFGKVKIVEGSFRRVCQTGQTVLEEVLFNQIPHKIALQRAKIINSAYLLQMKIEEFKKLKEELIRHGLRHHFQEMESIIKRNFIIKNWMRNKKR